jgi:hypothetical protein
MELFFCTREEYPFGSICHGCSGRTFAGAFYDSGNYWIQLCLHCARSNKQINLDWILEDMPQINEMEVV